MGIYSLSLFVHVVSAMAVAAALRLEILTLLQLRKATTSGDVRSAIHLVPGLPVVAMSSLVLLLLTGSYMTAQASAWSLAWPRVAVVTLVLIGPLGGVSGRKMRAIRQLSSAGQSANSELLRKLRDPFLMFSMILRVALVLGIVLLMTAKPGMTESLEAVGGFAIAGVAIALLFARRGMISPALNAGSQN